MHGSELNQVWTNLIDNAVDAMGKDGTLTIRARVDGPVRAASTSATTVPGIPEESRRRILEPFYTTKEPGKGTGLGLDTVRRIVEDRHDGSISFDTGADGTTFHVWLPITGATPSLARAEDTNNEETPR